MPGSPQDLDDESARRVARSFYIVRMVRYALLLVALVVFLVVCIVQGVPRVVVIAMVVAIVGMLVAVAATHRRYVSSRRLPSGRPSSRSPRG
jgi:hypothetical protein